MVVHFVLSWTLINYIFLLWFSQFAIVFVSFARYFERWDVFQELLPWIHVIERIDAAGFSISKIVIKYVLNGSDAKGRELFLQKMHQYLSPQLGGEVITIAQSFREEGIQQGIHQGIQQGEATFFTRQLKHRFNQVPESYLKRIEQADAETLLSWGEKILDAKTLEEIFE